MVFLFRYSHFIFVKKIGQEKSTTNQFFRASPSYKPEPFFKKLIFHYGPSKIKFSFLATL